MAVRQRKAADGSRRWAVDLRFRPLTGPSERYRKDAQVQTRAGAQAEERRVLAHFAQHGTIAALLAPSTAKKAPTWGDAVERFRTVTFEVGGRSGQGFAANTRATYGSVLDSPLLVEWRSHPLEAIDYKLVEEFIATKLKDASSALRRLYVAVIRSVISAFTGARPILPQVPRSAAAGKPARDEDLNRIFSDREPGPRRGQREAVRWAIFVTRHLGLRGGETMALRWRDIHLDEAKAIVQQQLTAGEYKPTKGGKPRVVPIPPALDAELRDALARRSAKPEDFVCTKANGEPWRGLGAAVRRTFRRLRIEGRPLHPIRHTYLTAIARHDPVAAQQIAGHASLETTMGYVHHVDDARKRTAVLAAFGEGNRTPTESVIGGAKRKKRTRRRVP